MVFWVSKFLPKSGKLVCFFKGEKKMVVKTVWVLKYAFPAQQKLCSENLHLFLHVEAIPTTKKNTGGNLRILKDRGAAGGRSREHFRPKPPWQPPFGSTYNDNYVSCLSVNWHDVWRHVGLSDAKNSDVKGMQSKKLFNFYCFFGVLIFPSFFFFSYLVFRR